MSIPTVFHPVPLTTEVKFIGAHEGDPRITVMHYRRPSFASPPTSAELSAFAQLWFTNVGLRLADCVSETTQWTAVTATDISTATGATGAYMLNPVAAGTNTGEPLPGDVNVAVAKLNGSRRRGGTGRTFVMDLVEGFVNDAVIQNALITLLIRFATAMLLPLTQGGNAVVPVVASKKHGDFWPILAGRFDTITDTQRQRLKYHKKHKRARIA